MKTTHLFKQLEYYQALVLNLCLLDKFHYDRQLHPDLSPTGWHLGHCVYTEIYWIREMLLGDQSCDENLAWLFNPELSDKQKRASSLPDHQDLCKWAGKYQAEHRVLLQKYYGHRKPLGLIQNDFLLYFLIQHYAQHFETMQMNRTQATRQSGAEPTVKFPLRSSVLDRSAMYIPAGHYRVGASGKHLPYDNEYPGHLVELKAFHISKHPVTNAEYLRFMEQGGYGNKAYWSTAGWTWSQQNRIDCPEYWCKNKDGYWYGYNPDGPIALDVKAPLYGISHYEAEAFANWAEARLPHECEWEAARTAGVLENTGQVWEWCQNTFYPYNGFQAYPYDGYSLPYFDQKHYTLKGGSQLTRTVIKRPSFRNYYEADKRYIYGGLRLKFN